MSYFHQAVNNDKDISVYFAIIKALRQVNDIVNRNISHGWTGSFNSFKKLGGAEYRVFIQK